MHFYPQYHAGLSMPLELCNSKWQGQTMFYIWHINTHNHGLEVKACIPSNLVLSVKDKSEWWEATAAHASRVARLEVSEKTSRSSCWCWVLITRVKHAQQSLLSERVWRQWLLQLDSPKWSTNTRWRWYVKTIMIKSRRSQFLNHQLSFLLEILH